MGELQQLSRVVPAHTVTFVFRSVAIDWVRMGPKWRRSRGGMKNKLNSCFWCHHKFEDGEMMSLGFSMKGNKMLCRTCVGALKEARDQ